MGFDKNKKEADVQNAQKKGKIGLIVGAFLLAFWAEIQDNENNIHNRGICHERFELFALRKADALYQAGKAAVGADRLGAGRPAESVCRSNECEYLYLPGLQQDRVLSGRDPGRGDGRSPSAKAVSQLWKEARF